MNMAPGERPVSMVLQDIVHNIQDIVRSEVRLAKSELGNEMSRAREAGLLLAIGALSVVFCTAFALLAAVYALSQVVPDWAAALIVAVSVGIVAAVTVTSGLKRFKTVRGAPKTIASVKENVEWAKRQTK